MVATLNKLCAACQDIFRGLWAPRPWPVPELDSIDLEDATDNGLEGRDWSRLLEEGSSPISARHELPVHHSIPDLESSAEEGCHLCTMIWDKIPQRHTGHENDDPVLWQLLWQKSARLIGVVAIRPYADIGDIRQELCLELSYYLDGASDNPQAYFCTVDLDLWPDQDSSSPVRNVVDLSLNVRPSTVKRVLAWSRQCTSEHPECIAWNKSLQNAENSFVLPTRLLEVVSGPKELSRLRLREGRSLPPFTRYTTLSHCWGKESMTSLLESNIDQFAISIPFSSLPKSFREAIEFTRNLGVGYLWIDALCIIQDSQEDWLHEALLMSSVYSNSYLNIAATSSKNGNGGLFVAQNPFLANPCMIEANWEGLPPGIYVCYDDSARRRRIDGGPLNKRAWVLQERLLAPRVVHFAYDQVWWECLCVRACESFPEGIREERNEISTDAATAMRRINVQSRKTLNQDWLAIVEKYTECGLSKKEDKLVALAGVAKAVQMLSNLPEEDYLAGLWKGDLARDLLWHVTSTGTRPSGYQAPSWSWASVEGAVVFNNSGARSSDSPLAVEILDAYVDSGNKGPFGVLKGACLKVAAPIFQVSLHDQNMTAGGHPSPQKLAINGRAYSKSEKNLSISVEDEQRCFQWAPGGRKFFFCRFGTTATIPAAFDYRYMSDGLLLERVGSCRGEYQRIGWIRLFHDEAEDELRREMQGPGLAEIDYIAQLKDGRSIILLF